MRRIWENIRKIAIKIKIKWKWQRNRVREFVYLSQVYWHFLPRYIVPYTLFNFGVYFSTHRFLHRASMKWWTFLRLYNRFNFKTYKKKECCCFKCFVLVVIPVYGGTNSYYQHPKSHWLVLIGNQNKCFHGRWNDGAKITRGLLKCVNRCDYSHFFFLYTLNVIT